MCFFERMCKMSGQKVLAKGGLSPDLSLSSPTFAMTGALAWQVTNLIKIQFFVVFWRGVRTGVARVLPSAVVWCRLLCFFSFCSCSLSSFPLFTLPSYSLPGWIHYPHHLHQQRRNKLMTSKLLISPTCKSQGQGIFFTYLNQNSP